MRKCIKKEVIMLVKCPHCKKDIEIKLLKKKKGTGGISGAGLHMSTKNKLI